MAYDVLWMFNPGGAGIVPCCEEVPTVCEPICVVLTDRTTGVAISGVTIDAGVLGSGTTDSLGRLCFEGATVGTRYVFYASKTGYLSNAAEHTLTEGDCTSGVDVPITLITSSIPNDCRDFQVNSCNCGLGGVAITLTVASLSYTQTVYTDWYGRARICVGTTMRTQSFSYSLSFSKADYVTQTATGTNDIFNPWGPSGPGTTRVMAQLDDSLRWCYRNIPDGISGVDCREYYPDELTVTFGGTWPGDIQGHTYTVTRDIADPQTWKSGCLATPSKPTAPTGFAITVTTTHTGACGNSPTTSIMVNFLINGHPTCTSNAGDDSYVGDSAAESGGSGGCPVSFYTGFTQQGVGGAPYTTSKTATVTE